MATEARKLRVGLLLGGLSVPAWVARMLERIASDGHADIALLVVDGSPPGAGGTPLLQRLKKDPIQALDGVAQRLLTLAIDHVGQAQPSWPDVFEHVDLANTFGKVPRLDVLPRRTQWSDRLEDRDVEAIKAADLDVLVRLGFRILRGGILQAARSGIWSFHHGDNDVNRGGPPGYWESMTDWTVTGCTLQILSEDLDNGLVLDKTWAQTIHGSVEDNNRSTYAKSASMLPRALARLQRLGHDAFIAQSQAARPHPQWYSNRLYRAPETRELARLLAHRIARRFKRVVRARFGFDQWVLLVHVSEAMSLSFWRYKRLVPPKDRFWADPFLWAAPGKTWVFYEELMYGTGRGHIAVAELTPEGQMVDARPAVVEAHHLSYPFVFGHKSEVYMVPEARADRCIPIYRCVEMPDRWERLGNLMDDVEAVDATLHFEQGRWWLFVNMVENEGGSSSDELFLFHREDLLTGEWTPHPMNPIVSDVRQSRPAGKIFRHEGRLYRPSQDCGQRYGYGLNLCCIETLTPDTYKETVVSRATPSWARDLRAIHTFNKLGRLHIADAQIRRSRWR